VLLSSARNTLNGRKLEATCLHPSENEIERLNPHGNWCVNLVAILVLVDPAMNAIVRRVFVKDDSFFIDWFEFGGHGKTCRRVGSKIGPTWSGAGFLHFNPEVERSNPMYVACIMVAWIITGYGRLCGLFGGN